MAPIIRGNPVVARYLGTTPIIRTYRGTTLVWEQPTTAYVPNPSNGTGGEPTDTRANSFTNNSLTSLYHVDASHLALSLIHISEPTRRLRGSRMPSSA